MDDRDDRFGQAGAFILAVLWVTVLLIPFALLGRWVAKRWGAAVGVLVAVTTVLICAGTMMAFEAKADRDYARSDLRAREACRSIYWDDATNGGPPGDAQGEAWSACMAANGG